MLATASIRSSLCNDFRASAMIPFRTRHIPTGPTAALLDVLAKLAAKDKMCKPAPVKFLGEHEGGECAKDAGTVFSPLALANWDEFRDPNAKYYPQDLMLDYAQHEDNVLVGLVQTCRRTSCHVIAACFLGRNSYTKG